MFPHVIDKSVCLACHHNFAIDETKSGTDYVLLTVRYDSRLVPAVALEELYRYSKQTICLFLQFEKEVRLNASVVLRMVAVLGNHSWIL